MFLFDWINSIIYFIGLLGLLTFFVPYFIQAFVWNKEQDLKKKYNAQWALITGGSSGIGRALAEKLAKQGLNIVIVALDDPLLKEIMETLKKQYPRQEFRAVPVDLGADGYMEKIKEATKDITVQLVFNNAGYVLVGFFADLPVERQLKNVEVNAISSLKVTHHFVNKMIAAKVKGCVTFTSSPSGLIPTPITAMYGCTKAFLTSFASSLAAEVKEDGIDVLVVHPSPVDTNFYKADTVEKMDLLVAIGKRAAPPTIIASTILSSIGYINVVRDQGATAVGVKVLTKILDWNTFSSLYLAILPLQKEYKKLKAERQNKKTQ